MLKIPHEDLYFLLMIKTYFDTQIIVGTRDLGFGYVTSREKIEIRTSNKEVFWGGVVALHYVSGKEGAAQSAVTETIRDKEGAALEIT